MSIPVDQSRAPGWRTEITRVQWLVLLGTTLGWALDGFAGSLYALVLGPAMTDLLGGQVDIMCDQTTNTTSQIEGKKVKAYAVTTSKRLTTPSLKDLPTLQEEGLKGFEVTIWHGLYAPKGTPADILKKVNDALKVALKDPEFIKKSEGLSAVVANDNRVTPEGHKAFVQAEIAKWTPVIKAAGTFAE